MHSPPRIPKFDRFGAKGRFLLSVGRFLRFQGQRQELQQVVNNHDIIDIISVLYVQNVKAKFFKIRNDVRKNKRKKIQ